MSKKFILIATDKEEGFRIQTKAAGMNALEIIGILERKKQDIMKLLDDKTFANKEMQFIRKRVLDEEAPK